MRQSPVMSRMLDAVRPFTTLNPKTSAYTSPTAKTAGVCLMVTPTVRHFGYETQILLFSFGLFFSSSPQPGLSRPIIPEVVPTSR